MRRTSRHNVTGTRLPTMPDMDETRSDGDDDDEGGNSEDEDGEYEDGKGEEVMGRSHTPNGDRFTVFTSQQEQ